MLWCDWQEGAGEQFLTGNTLRQPVTHRQWHLTGDRFGVTCGGCCYSTDKKDGSKCTPRRSLTEGLPEIQLSLSTMGQGSLKIQTVILPQVWGWCSIPGAAAQPQGKASHCRDPAPRKTTQKGGYNLVWSGLVDIHGSGPEIPLDWGLLLPGDPLCWPRRPVLLIPPMKAELGSWCTWGRCGVGLWGTKVKGRERLAATSNQPGNGVGSPWHSLSYHQLEWNPESVFQC